MSLYIFNAKRYIELLKKGNDRITKGKYFFEETTEVILNDSEKLQNFLIDLKAIEFVNLMEEIFENCEAYHENADFNTKESEI